MSEGRGDVHSCAGVEEWTSPPPPPRAGMDVPTVLRHDVLDLLVFHIFFLNNCVRVWYIKLFCLRIEDDISLSILKRTRVCLHLGKFGLSKTGFS